MKGWGAKAPWYVRQKGPGLSRIQLKLILTHLCYNENPIMHLQLYIVKLPVSIFLPVRKTHAVLMVPVTWVERNQN